MTTDEKITMLRSMMDDDSDTDDTLSTFLTIAGKKILNRAYPYDPDKDELPEQYDTLQVEIALYMLNKRGGEGETAHSENGISRTYGSADVPEALLHQITPHVGVL